jgi:hypothetical protein
MTLGHGIGSKTRTKIESGFLIMTENCYCEGVCPKQSPKQRKRGLLSRFSPRSDITDPPRKLRHWRIGNSLYLSPRKATSYRSRGELKAREEGERINLRGRVSSARVVEV